MNKELIDRVWKYCLPKEFKEEVKKYYCTLHEQYKDYDGLHFQNAKAKVQERIVTVEYFFGKHNLTSDTEGEEMLIVSRKRVQEMYAHYDKICNDPNRPKDYIESVYEYADGVTMALDDLFGSKCLPDEDTDCTPVEVAVAENATTTQTSAEPKFKEGDIVRYRYDGKSYTVVCKTGKYYYALRQPDGAVMIHDVLESDLEPLTEQEVKRHVSVKEACEILGVDESEATKLVRSKPIETCTETCTDDYSSPDHLVVKDEMVDNIIKDGFKNHNRLHIAAILAAGMLASETRCYPVDRALELADALIAEAKK